MPAVFGAYLIGFIIESDGRRIDETPSRKEVLLNSAHALVFSCGRPEHRRVDGSAGARFDVV